MKSSFPCRIAVKRDRDPRVSLLRTASPSTPSGALLLSQTRPSGESLAQVLCLAGVKPVADSIGRVNKLELIPLEELGRPRIDVVVSCSGVFRDLFINQMNLLDRGVSWFSMYLVLSLLRRVYQPSCGCCWREDCRGGPLNNGQPGSSQTLVPFPFSVCGVTVELCFACWIERYFCLRCTCETIVPTKVKEKTPSSPVLPWRRLLCLENEVVSSRLNTLSLLGNMHMEASSLSSNFCSVPHIILEPNTRPICRSRWRPRRTSPRT